MRRFSQVDSWGFTPLADEDAMFPTRWPVRLNLRAAGLFGRLGAARMDVVMGRRRLHCRRRILWHVLDSQDIEVKDFIGVAVRRGMIKNSLATIVVRAVSAALSAAIERIGPAGKKPSKFSGEAEPCGGVLELFLLNEDCRRDVLLYRATGDHDITALWRYWSKALRLPPLLVNDGGLIEEPFEMVGAVAFRRALPRRKSYGLVGRRPVFSRVRTVGTSGPRRNCGGREIVARR